ncbi:hypothetical protein ACFL5O_02655 [Myxococcota bacterium]
MNILITPARRLLSNTYANNAMALPSGVLEALLLLIRGRLAVGVCSSIGSYYRDVDSAVTRSPRVAGATSLAQWHSEAVPVAYSMARAA